MWPDVSTLADGVGDLTVLTNIRRFDSRSCTVDDCSSW